MARITKSERVVRRQRLLDAAWRCLERSGYRDLTVDDVCAEAGLSKGSFYGYFEGKQDLLTSLLEQEAAALDHVAAELASASISGADRLRRYARAALEHGSEPARVQVRSDLWAALASDDRIRELFRESTRRRRLLLRRWIADSVEAGDLALEPELANALASILLALADGLMLHHALDPAGFRWKNIRAVLDALLGGIDRS
jgi:TetR/AcrR family transcriptional repressor of uid operon